MTRALLSVRNIFVPLFFWAHSFSAFAGDGYQAVLSYFVDNFIFQSLYSGGYYTLGVILLLVVISYFSKRFGEIFLSIILAIFIIMLLVFLYEELEDFELIPSKYS